MTHSNITILLWDWRVLVCCRNNSLLRKLMHYFAINMEITTHFSWLIIYHRGLRCSWKKSYEDIFPCEYPQVLGKYFPVEARCQSIPLVLGFDKYRWYVSDGLTTAPALQNGILRVAFLWYDECRLICGMIPDWLMVQVLGFEHYLMHLWMMFNFNFLSIMRLRAST